MFIRRGLETAVQVTTESATSAATRSFQHVFEVVLPTTVYVRASQCEIDVLRAPGNHVELTANLRASFGWDLVAEQDDAGVYIAAKRKPVVGAMSSAHFSLTVPPEANLVLNVTPGTIHLVDVNGKLNVPAVLPASKDG